MDEALLGILLTLFVGAASILVVWRWETKRERAAYLKNERRATYKPSRFFAAYPPEVTEMGREVDVLMLREEGYTVGFIDDNTPEEYLSVPYNLQGLHYIEPLVTGARRVKSE
jgi:hypothetical protein